MTIQKRPNVHPFPSNDGASYQINGKIATSKGGGKAHLRPFELVDLLLVTRFLTTKTFLYAHTLIFELFSKQTLCMRSYRNENHYKVTFSKYFQKTTPQEHSNKSK